MLRALAMMVLLFASPARAGLQFTSQQATDHHLKMTVEYMSGGDTSYQGFVYKYFFLKGDAAGVC
jgi:hypothetical protein